jgi:Repeat of unknown function (DUF346)
MPVENLPVRGAPPASGAETIDDSQPWPIRGTLDVKWERAIDNYIIAATSRAVNRLDIFARGTDNGIYHKGWDGSAWLPSPGVWEPLDGIFNSPPSAVAWGPNRLDIFALGSPLAFCSTIRISPSFARPAGRCGNVARSVCTASDDLTPQGRLSCRVIVVDPEPAAFNAASATTAAITNISPIATTERTHHRAYFAASRSSSPQG